jgi:hypothetical protein
MLMTVHLPLLMWLVDHVDDRVGLDVVGWMM